MAIEISYTEDRGVVVRASGKVKAGDLIDANNIIYSDKDRIRAIRYQLCDFTSVDFTNTTSDEVQVIAGQDIRAAELNPDMLTAIVGVQDVIYGLARMWQSYLPDSEKNTAVFRTLDEAWKWIHATLNERG